MEENNKGAVHVTKVDFDISPIRGQLKQIEELTKGASEVIGKTLNSSLTLDKDGKKIFENWSADVTYLDENLKKIKQTFAVTSKGIETETVKISENFTELNKQIKSAENLLNRIEGKYSSALGSSTDLENNKKFTEAYFNELVKIDSLLSKMKAPDYELSKEDITSFEKISKTVDNLSTSFSKATQFQKEFSSELKKENQQREKTSKSIEKLIENYEKLENQIKKTNQSSKNTTLLKEIEKVKEDLNSTLAKGNAQNIFSDEQILQVKKYEKELVGLNETFKSGNKTAENYLSVIGDKAKWLGAFLIVNQIRESFIETITVIKDTETAVMELRRVLSEDIDDISIQEEIYGLAGEYGRTFAEVSDTATKFAQAGYEWNEVLKLTESTMLAVNTAELEVSSATTGLIAVISQFNLTADDMFNIVDKINITADNFPVTSEKIVSALQRAGGSANNANVSLEQMIAIIASLSKETGRSGETIGTALNSLISFSQQARSLEIFASLSADMDKLVSQFNSGTKSIVDLWKGLSTEISNLTIEQSGILEQLYASEDFKEFADELESQAGEVTESIRSVYQTAGTNRQNYFIGLLSEMSSADGTYTKALENMTEAQGYSLKENEQYIQTLASEYNQLIVALQELAVQVGNAGGLTTLKFIVDTATEVAKTTKSIGGLNTVLAITLTIVANLKKNKIAKILNPIIGTKLTRELTKFNVDLAQTDPLFKKAKFSANSFGTALKSIGLISWIGIVTTVISVVVQGIETFRQKMEELREEARQSAEDFNNYAKNINELSDKYIELSTQVNKSKEAEAELLRVKTELETATNIQLTGLDKTIGKRKEDIELINKEIQKEYELLKAKNNASGVMEKSNKELFDALPFTAYQPAGAVPMIETAEYQKALKEISKIEGLVVNELGDISIFAEGNLIKQKEIIEEIIFILQRVDDTGDGLAKTLAEININDVLLPQLTRTEETIKENIDLVNQMSQAEAYYQKTLLQTEIAQISTASSTEEQKKLYDELVNSIKTTNYEQGFTKDLLLEMISQVFPQLNKVITETEGPTKILGKNFESINQAIRTLAESDKFISSLKEEFANFGKLSATSIDEIIKRFPELEDAVYKQKTGVISWGELMLELSKYYEADHENYITLIKTKSFASNDFYTHLIESENKTLGKLAEIYKLDAKNFASVQEFKLKVLQKINDDIKYNQEEADYWSTVPGAEQLQGYYETKVSFPNKDYLEKELDKLLGDLDFSIPPISFETNGYSGSGGVKEQLSEYEKQLKKLTDTYGPLLSLEKQRLSFLENSNAPLEEQNKQIDKIQNTLHLYAEALRGIGASEEEILKLSTEWWSYENSQSKERLTNIKNAYEPLLSLEKQRLSFLENSNAPLEKQNAQIDKIQNTLHLYAEALREIGASEEEILKLSTEWWSYENSQLDDAIKNTEELVDKTVSGYEDIIDKRVELLEKEKEAIRDRYDSEKEALQDVQDERERIRAKEEYFEDLADAKKTLAEAESRSGVDYQEAESDAKEEISDINKNWQQQIEDWATQDAIQALDDLAEKEEELIDKVIEGLELSFEKFKEKPYETVEEAKKAFDEINKEFNANFIDPMSESAIKLFGVDMQDIADITSMNVYDSFKVNFTDRLKSDLMEVFLEAERSKNSYLATLKDKTTNLSNSQKQSISTTISKSYGGNTNTQNMFINTRDGNSMNNIVRNTKNAFDLSTSPRR